MKVTVCPPPRGRRSALGLHQHGMAGALSWWRPPAGDTEADATSTSLIAWWAMEKGIGGQGRRTFRVGFGELGWEKQVEGRAEEFPKPPAEEGLRPPSHLGHGGWECRPCLQTGAPSGRSGRAGHPGEAEAGMEKGRMVWVVFFKKRGGNFRLPLKDTIVIIGLFFF